MRNRQKGVPSTVNADLRFRIIVFKVVFCVIYPPDTHRYALEFHFYTFPNFVGLNLEAKGAFLNAPVIAKLRDLAATISGLPEGSFGAPKITWNTNFGNICTIPTHLKFDLENAAEAWKIILANEMSD